METLTGISRSSINLRSTPDPTSSVVDALSPNEPIEILEEKGNTLRVQAAGLQPPISGFVPKSAVIQNKPKQQVFSKGISPLGKEYSSVPPSLPVSDFLAWLDSPAEPPWLPADLLDAIRLREQPSVGDQIRQVIASHQVDWQAWVADIKSQGRQAMAAMNEWQVLMSGGLEMWSFRTERIFSEPSQSAPAPAWVSPEDVLHWTGRVRVNNQEPKYKTWVEVEFTKLDRVFKGWYKASLLEEFFFPTPETDLRNPKNRDRVFDLSRPLLHIPADPEIQQAKTSSRLSLQYIDIKQALGWGQVNHNLCGEFCAAALGGSDVLPFLKKWLGSYPKAKEILTKDYGTSVVDLQSMLGVFGKEAEYFRAEGSVAPLTPGYLHKNLEAGRMAIIGVGITRSGAMKVSSGIRHWLVIEDILRVGNSGWLRVYNPFFNREDVHPFEAVVDARLHSGLGVWVEPARP